MERKRERLDMNYAGTERILVEQESGVGCSGPVRFSPEPRVIPKSRSAKPFWVCHSCRTAWMICRGSMVPPPGSRLRYLGPEVAGIAQACRGSVVMMTLREPPRDFRLCRWRNRSRDRIYSCCSDPPAARGSPSSSCSLVALYILVVEGRSENSKIRIRTDWCENYPLIVSIYDN